MENEEIICPVCGCKTWKLYKYRYPNGKCGIRVSCCTPHCQVDNVAIFESNVGSIIWELIEAEK